MRPGALSISPRRAGQGVRRPSKTKCSSPSGCAIYHHRMRVQWAIRNWWPILAFVAIALATQTVFTSNVDANGQHAEDHLRSATAPFAIAFLIALIVWAAPKARRRVDVWAAAATLGVAACFVLLGNLRVIHAIAGDAWTDTEANILGPWPPLLRPARSPEDRHSRPGGSIRDLFDEPGLADRG